MSSVWIILLDTSGSMEEGFSNQSGTSPDPLGEIGAWATKLDAAKELLLRQVSALRAQDIAILRFSDDFEKIFHGPRDVLLGNRTLIQGLEAGGGTSIATALEGVKADTAFEQYRSVSVLVLTDGLSDREQAVRAAKELIDKYPFARIDTILIDETDEGRNVADGISVNGTVRTATSTVQLRSAITGARAADLRSELSNMALMRFQAQRELSSFELLAQPTLLTVTSDHSLTASTLRHDLAPTLAGIEAIGQGASQAAHIDYVGSVSSISQDSPISINLTGLKDAVELVLTYVIPWRRQNAERLAGLEVRKQEIEVERAEHDLNSLDIDQERRKLENLRLQLDLAKSKWDLAERMLKELDPDSHLRGEAREQVLTQLLVGVNRLSTTNLEFRVVRELSNQ